MEDDKYQVMPPLSDEEYEALKASIAKAGRIYNPIIKDGEGNIIDGHNRARALVELGIANDHRVGETHLRNLSEAEARMLARRLNLGRRHLSREQIAQVVRDVKAEHPRWSARKLSQELGGMPSQMTVEKILAERSTDQTSQLTIPPKVESRDGRDRPASAEAAADQRARITTAIEQDPTRSNREIAAEIGCAHPTVARVRKGNAATKSNETGQPQAPEKPVRNLAAVVPPPDLEDVRDARTFAADLEMILVRALGRQPDKFLALLPPKRRAALSSTLRQFGQWSERATTGDAS